MIISNLEALLKERKLKISKVSVDTGISRTTLTMLCNNTGKGVQFDTANDLCIYLNIDMGQLFTTLPFDITVKGSRLLESPEPEWLIAIDLLYSDRRRKETPCFVAEVHSFTGFDENEEDIAEVEILPLAECLNVPDGNTDEENRLLCNAIKSMPPAAKQILKDQIASEIVKSSSFSKAYAYLPDELN